MKAQIWFQGLVVFSIAVALCCSVSHETVAAPTHYQSSDKNIDDSDLPISSDEVKDTLNRKYSNVLLAYQLIRRASRQHQSAVAYDTLYALRSKLPDDPAVLAEYCLVFDMAAGITSSYRTHEFSQADDADYQKTLSTAFKLNPKLWLTYVVRGERTLHTPVPLEPGVRDLETAVRLAPGVSYTHYLLAYAYGIPHQTFSSTLKSIREADVALSLEPPVSDAALLLFETYAFPVGSRPSIQAVASAKAARMLFLSMLPEGTPIRPAVQQMLDQYK